MSNKNVPPFGMGDTGNAVKAIQAKLRSFAPAPVAGQKLTSVFTIDVDGIYGPQTESAVAAYQANLNLVVSGVVDHITFDMLYPPPKHEPHKRGKCLRMTLKDTLDRAKNCVGAPINYHLAYPNGGDNPEAAMPCDEDTGQLDCSGFNAWVNGVDRLLKGVSKTLDKWGGYMNTDSKIAEAEAEGKVWSIHETPEVGDIIVGESFRSKLTLRRVIGHEGFITAVDNYKLNGLKGLEVIHCSSSNAKRNQAKSAVWKTDGTIWKGYKKVRFLRFNREYVLSKQS